MSYLKGNFDVKKKVSGPADAAAEKGDSTSAFESFARERLGGSIAFVMKQNTFVWEGSDDSGKPVEAGAEKPAEVPAKNKS